jgi:hypothetical protein
MKQEADIADRELRDLADFFVTEVALKFEVHDFTLILRQGFDESKNLTYRFALFELGINADIGLFEWSHPRLPFAHIEGEVPADGEKPLDEVPVDFRSLFPAQP